MSTVYKIVAFLEQDTIDHLDRIAHFRAIKNRTEPTRSEAIKYLVMQHWKQTMINVADRKTKPKVIRP